MRNKVKAIIKIMMPLVVLTSASIGYCEGTITIPTTNGLYEPDTIYDRKIYDLTVARLLATGWDMDEAEQMEKAYKKGRPVIPSLKPRRYEFTGKPILPFIDPIYDEYDLPTENGHDGDLLLIRGTIEEYIKTGDQSSYTIGVRVRQEDGCEWMVACAQKLSGKLIGAAGFSKDKTIIFEGLDGQAVEIYGEYIGYSEKFELPVLNIVDFGGMYVAEEQMWYWTTTAEIETMTKHHLGNIQSLIGGKGLGVSSTEGYR